jgi:hypothetical protein
MWSIARARSTSLQQGCGLQQGPALLVYSKDVASLQQGCGLQQGLALLVYSKDVVYSKGSLY